MKVARVSFIIAISLIVIASGAFFFWRSRSGSSAPRTATAQKADVVQDVTFSGRLEPRVESTLGFEYTGKVTEVLVREGDRVSAGQDLVKIDDTVARLEVAQARASRLSSADQLYASWQKAEQDAQLTEQSNSKLLEAKEQAVRDAKTEMDQKKEYWLQVERENGNESSTTKTAYATFLASQTAYRSTRQALESAQASANQSQSLARSSADVARKQYQATQQSAEGSSGLSSLEATEELAQVKISKSVLSAPLGAVVTKLDLEPGQIVTAGQTIVTLATTDDLEITAKVPETDAVKIESGQSATITFDALPSTQSWSATVNKVASSATIVEGVPTYEVTLLMNTINEQHKAGLTANVTVHTSHRENVIAIPRRAVLTRDSNQYVRVWDGVVETEQEVATGLTGSDGLVEITSGLSEGAEVIIESQK